MTVLAMIAPLEFFELRYRDTWQLSGDVRLAPTPQWLRADSMLHELSGHDRDAVKESMYSLVATCEAEGYRSRDQFYRTGEASVEESHLSYLRLANVALWLCRATCATYRIIVRTRDQIEAIEQLEQTAPLMSMRGDLPVVTESSTMQRVAALHATLVPAWQAPERNPLHVSIEALWAALTAENGNLRFLLFWVALEALMGPKRSGGLTVRLANRIAFFLGTNADESAEVFAMVKGLYRTRSKLVHGKRTGILPTTFISAMRNTEEITRRCLLRVLCEPGMMDTFRPARRETFLKGLEPKSEPNPSCGCSH